MPQARCGAAASGAKPDLNGWAEGPGALETLLITSGARVNWIYLLQRLPGGATKPPPAALRMSDLGHRARCTDPTGRVQGAARP